MTERHGSRKGEIQMMQEKSVWPQKSTAFHDVKAFDVTPEFERKVIEFLQTHPENGCILHKDGTIEPTEKPRPCGTIFD